MANIPVFVHSVRKYSEDTVYLDRQDCRSNTNYLFNIKVQDRVLCDQSTRGHVNVVQPSDKDPNT